MDEKERKTLIIISSVFIFVLVFMVFFTFYRRDAMLSDRTIPKINTDINNLIPEEDPPSHGDSCGYTCSSGTISGTNCVGQKSKKVCKCGDVEVSSSTTYCTNLGTSVLVKPTCTTQYYTAVVGSAYYTCTSCSSGKYLSGGSCQSCPSDKPLSPGGSGGIEGCYAATPAPTATPNNCTIAYCSSYISQTNSYCKCKTCNSGYHILGDGYACGKDETPVSTPNTCDIAYCSSYVSQTNSYCKCKTCNSGYHILGDGYGCGKDETPATVNCCVNGNFKTNVSESSCSAYQRLEGSSCVCTKGTMNSSGVCVDNTSSKQCYKFADNTCTAETVSGTTCNNSNNYYSSWAECRENIVCDKGQYKYGNFCESCPSGKTVAYSGCQGNAGTCCVDASSTTIKCYARSGSQCVEVNVAGSSCGGTGTNSYSSRSECESHLSKKCWRAADLKCTQVTVTGSSCDNSSYYYETYAECGRNLYCGPNGYSQGGVCVTCGENAELNAAKTSCVCKDGYAKVSGKCTKISDITAPCCITDGKGSASGTTDTICSAAASSGKTVTSGYCPTYKCCCNLASGNCSMATICTGSLMTEQSNITSAASCTSLTAGLGSACYKDSSGNYVWGLYGNDSNYKYVVSLDKNSCLKKNEGDGSDNECVLRCPSSVLSIGENINCTFESSDGSSLASANSSNSSVASATRSSRFVNVDALSSGSTTVTGTSSSGCVTNPVSISVYDRNDENGSCKITSVTTNSRLVSQDADNYSSNSYYTVFVNIEGVKCSGRTLTVKENHGAINKSVTVNSSGRSSQYSFLVYPNLGCNETSTTTATLSDGGGSGSVSVTLTSDWSEPEEVCVSEDDATYTSFLLADMDSAGEYYSHWDGERNCYTQKRTRGCGSSGTKPPVVTPPPGQTPTPTPAPTYACYANAEDLINATATIWATGGSTSYPYLISGKSQSECKAYACFVNQNGTDYKWANTTPSGYKKVDSILSQSLCKPEDNACYIDSSGEYHWGKYKNNSSYTFVASITDETKCKKIEDAACYSNGDKYVWDTSSPGDGYVKVPELDTSVKCAKDDNGCFLHNNKYAWGNYFNKFDYYYVAGITEQEYCSNYGCYVNGNEYVWGDYSDDDSYKLVKDITDRNRCGVTPDVPKTSLNTQVIVYIATAIMCVAGIYFVVRYNNKSKNI